MQQVFSIKRLNLSIFSISYSNTAPIPAYTSLKYKMEDSNADIPNGTKLQKPGSGTLNEIFSLSVSTSQTLTLPCLQRLKKLQFYCFEFSLANYHYEIKSCGFAFKGGAASNESTL